MWNRKQKSEHQFRRAEWDCGLPVSLSVHLCRMETPNISGTVQGLSEPTCRKVIQIFIYGSRTSMWKSTSTLLKGKKNLTSRNPGDCSFFFHFYLLSINYMFCLWDKVLFLKFLPTSSLSGVRDSPSNWQRPFFHISESLSRLKNHIHLERWDGVGSGREVQEGGGIYIPMADSCWSRADTNTIS